MGALCLLFARVISLFCPQITPLCCDCARLLFQSPLRRPLFVGRNKNKPRTIKTVGNELKLEEHSFQSISSILGFSTKLMRSSRKKIGLPDSKRNMFHIVFNTYEAGKKSFISELVSVSLSRKPSLYQSPVASAIVCAKNPCN